MRSVWTSQLSIRPPIFPAGLAPPGCRPRQMLGVRRPPAPGRSAGQPHVRSRSSTGDHMVGSTCSPSIRRTGMLLIIEIKTRLDDLGALERQIAWYERMAGTARRAASAGSRRASVACVLALASDEVERVGASAPRSAVDRLPDAAPGIAGGVLVDPGWVDRRAWLRADRPIEPASRLADPNIGRWSPVAPAATRYADAARPAAASIARAPADTNEPSEPRPMNRKPRSSSGGSPAAS